MTEARSAGLCITSGSTYPEFAENVAGHLGVEATLMERRRFSNGELFVRYEESLRGKDVFVFQTHDGQSTVHDRWSINDAIQEQILMIDAAVGASADHVTAVCPYFGYSRQDKKTDGRVAIAARRIARQLIDAGAERIISMDLHSAQTQGFTDDNKPFENVYGSSVILPRVKEWAADKDPTEIAVVTPDTGGIKRAAYYRKKLSRDPKDHAEVEKVELAIIDKDRSPDSSKVEAVYLVGKVAGRHCVVVDDMFDTAKTLAAAGNFLLQRGALSVIAAGTHGLFSGSAVDYLNDSDYEKVIVADTISQHAKELRIPKQETVSVTEIFAEAAKRIHYNDSVSGMFEDGQL